MPPSENSGSSKKPIWNGKGTSKWTKNASLYSRMTKGTVQPIPIELQQLLLNVFRDTFRFGDELPTRIQEVKQHLFNRDFAKAFGSERLLEAYAARWSATRTLAYTDLLCSIPQLSEHFTGVSNGTSNEGNEAPSAREPLDTHVGEAATVSQPNSGTPNGLAGRLKVACLGGGAGAELVAFAGYLHSHANNGIAVLDIIVVDIADWSSIIEKLHSTVITSPKISLYSSYAFKMANKPIIRPEQLKYDFIQKDVLSLDIESLAAIVQGTALVTLMFTLNELYSTSMSQTTNLLLSLTYLLEPGSLLLVVDSPGSYSTVKIGNIPVSKPTESEKRYPMKWLLDHTLLEASTIGSSKSSTQGGQWEKVTSQDSKWFRLSKDLKYPIDLEDTRYQIHLYRRK